MKSKQRDTLRVAVQIGFFVLVALIAVNHTLEESGRAIPVLSTASLHAVCPFGGVVSVYEYLDSGTMVKKTHGAGFVLMWIGFAAALLVGPAFCGWLCPFGSVQEWFGRLGGRFFGRRYNRFVPQKLDRYLRYARYLVLAWVVYVTASTASLVFADFDPYFALFNFWSSEVAIGGLIVLGIVLLLSLFVERPFCKYACPYGALLGMFNLVRLFRIKRNEETCIDCKACDRACPMNIPVSKRRTVFDVQCISCLKCTSDHSCPVPGTVELVAGRLEKTAAPATGGEA